MISYYSILSGIFVVFGLYSVLYPSRISYEPIERCYSVKDLIRGCGIYSTTIGLLLYYRGRHTRYILTMCFISSIIWNISIIRKNYSFHNVKSAIYNLLGLLLIIIN